MTLLYAFLYFVVIPTDDVRAIIDTAIEDGLLPSAVAWAFERLPVYFAFSITLAAVSFMAFLLGGTTNRGLFLDVGGSDSAILLAGESAPPAVGGR